MNIKTEVKESKELCSHPDRDHSWKLHLVCSSCYIHLLRVEHYPETIEKEELEMLKKKGVEAKKGNKGGRTRDGSKSAMIEEMLKDGKDVGAIVAALTKLNP